jgi:hypothetical protein
MASHQSISFVKSIVRISGYGVFLASPAVCMALLILAEMIGIVEEIGHE